MVRTRANHLDRRARPAGGLERDVHALVRDELGDDQQRVAWCADTETIGFDRRIDDRRRTPVETLDALLRDPRVGDVVVNTAARGEVRLAHPVQQHAERPPQRPTHFPEPALTLGPEVAERRVTVTDVDRTWWCVDSMGEGAAATEHDVSGGEREPLDGEWIKWKQSPESALARPELLQHRTRDGMLREATIVILLSYRSVKIGRAG